MHRVPTGSQNLVEEAFFTFLLYREIHKATRLQYCLSLLCFTPDARRGTVDRAFLDRLARLSLAELRATDFGTCLEPSCVALLLVDADIKNLKGIFHRIQQGVEPMMRQSLSAGGGCFPQTATTGSDLVKQAVDFMVRAKDEGGDRLKIPA